MGERVLTGLPETDDPSRWTIEDERFAQNGDVIVRTGAGNKVAVFYRGYGPEGPSIARARAEFFVAASLRAIGEGL